MKLKELYRKSPAVVLNVVAFVLGVVAGLLSWRFGQGEGLSVRNVVAVVSPFGDILVLMLKMVVIPIIFVSLINGAVSIKLKEFGRIGIFVFCWYLVTSIIAAVWGTVSAFLCNPKLKGAEELAGNMMAKADALRISATSGDISPILNIFFNLFKNPFEALAKGDFLSIIVFAILFGFAASIVLDTAKGTEAQRHVQLVLDSMDGVQRIIFKLVEWVMMYFPLGVFALTFSVFASFGVPLLISYIQVAGCVIFGIAVMMCVCYPLLIFLFTRENPYRIMLQLREPILTAFVTRSSAAALPVSIRTASQNLGIKREVSGFTLAIGATVNMDGVCVHLPVFAILAANLFGIDLTIWQSFAIIISVVFASIGTGGVPGGSLFLLFMVLDCLHLTPEQSSMVVALALGINPLLDMFETACNVAGDNVANYVAAKRLGMME